MSTAAEVQPEEIRILRRLSAQLTTRTMVDIGAHHGLTLEPFVRAGFEVHAFEPVESNRIRLRERLGERPNLSLRPEAVSRESGTARLHLATRPDGSDHDHYHSLERIEVDRHHRRGESVNVATVCLDDLVANGELPGAVGVLKVDTEGHDLAVLEGASTLSCQVITVEFWGREHALGPSPSPPESMVELASGRGFDSFVVVEHLHGATGFRFNSVEGAEPEAWGNIVFFHRTAKRLYDEIAAWCRRGGPEQIDPLAELLSRWIPGRDGLRVFDIGAFRGDFTVDLLESFPGSNATLFEPAAENLSVLSERFSHDPRIELRAEALGADEGRRSFNFIADAPATGSLLQPLQPGAAAEPRSVEVTTLDRAWDEAGRPPLDLIKVDTQGEDLNVLRGAVGAVAAHHPVLVIEAIFVPLYVDQAAPDRLFAFAADAGYRLARILNVNHTRGGDLAFADLVFVDDSLSVADLEPPFLLSEPADTGRLREALREANEDRHRKRAAIQRLRGQRDALRSRLESS